MKQVILITLAAASIYSPATAQNFAFLDANNIRAQINSSGHLFSNNDKKGFEFPVGSGNSTLYGSSLVVGAQNASGTVYAASMANFYPGPLLAGMATPSTHAAAWDRVWKISLAEIDYHLAHYTDAGYVPATVIAEWPANGNAAWGEPEQIAPFVDANGNGLYEPLLGEYPLIKGTQAVFFVLNDQLPGPTGNVPLGIEIQCMAYVFDCAGNSALDNTVFVNYKFIHKGTLTYYNAYAGILSDTDIGYFLDDYIGCNVSKGFAYAYNGDNYDEPHDGADGYLNNLPVQGMAILAGPWQDDDGTDNPVINDYNAANAANGIVYPALGMGYDDDIIDNERLSMNHFISYNGVGAPNASMSDPDNGEQEYNYLKGLWRDGSPLSYGGMGYPGLSGVTDTLSDYIYFGDTDPFHAATHGLSVPTSWTEPMVGNSNGDRRGLCSSGSFTLAPGESNELDMAFTAAIDIAGSGNPLAALPTLNARIGSVRNYFNNNLTPCGSFYNNVNEVSDETNISLYPNPVNHVLNIQLPDGFPQTDYTLCDAYGKTVASGTVQGNSGSITVSSLENGFYFIRIKGMKTKKFVVQR